MSSEGSQNDSLLLSYMTLRRAVGVVGVSLPFVLAFGEMLLGSPGILASISSYYWAGMGDVFVGSLFVIGTFLMTYRGYERIDNLAGHFACGCAIGVAVFPTTPDDPLSDRLTGQIHYGFAALLFLTLAFFALFLFRKTNPDRPRTPQKVKRDRVYTVCGWLIVACIVLLAIVGLALPDDAAIHGYAPVFWLETTAILAFGVSWLTKGEAILGDR